MRWYNKTNKQIKQAEVYNKLSNSIPRGKQIMRKIVSVLVTVCMLIGVIACTGCLREPVSLEECKREVEENLQDSWWAGGRSKVYQLNDHTLQINVWEDGFADVCARSRLYGDERATESWHELVDIADNLADDIYRYCKHATRDSDLVVYVSVMNDITPTTELIVFENGELVCDVGDEAYDEWDRTDGTIQPEPYVVDEEVLREAIAEGSNVAIEAAYQPGAYTAGSASV